MPNAVEALKFSKNRNVPIAGIDDNLVRAETRVASLLVALSSLAKIECDIAAEHRLIDQLCETVDRIRRTKPQSLVGAAVKLRVMLHLDPGGACDAGDTLTALHDVLAVVEREVTAHQTCTATTRRAA